METHGLDNEKQVFFYEQDFYMLSNFSSFRIRMEGINFDTAEVAYHWFKFLGHHTIQNELLLKRSAHDAFKFAEANKRYQREGWDTIRRNVMREILRCKVEQHPYVRRKLLATGDRELIENSWRDPYWGWGPNKDGENMLGKLWMEVREELRTGDLR